MWEHGLQKRSKVPPKGSEGQSKGEINNDPRNNRSWPCGTIHHRITGASKDAFLTGLPGRPIHGQVNGTRKQACTHPRTTRTMEQDSNCVSGFILVSRVDLDPGKRGHFP
ncbi:hypothetical protein CRG98_019893 [Punica granatum]|uniref:Uncharacterized protein n=1 Tax=Punica granatum TaxID=22663 RepID=A0A2I0JTS0_PUNGR|nr:hypothetical protein CRG98_019893 [Punica granatum]